MNLIRLTGTLFVGMIIPLTVILHVNGRKFWIHNHTKKKHY